MQVNEYQKEAMATLNPALNQKDVLINSVMGLCGESGEAIDLVKKWLMQGHELDKEHLIKELGDVAWYLAEASRCNATAWCVSIFAWQTAPVLDHTLRSWADRAI